jgi:antitoxin (DNA-binding transcriptional repressor) of toxin-antitoxin stability system
LTGEARSGYISYMKIANISYTKNHLSALLNCVREGESVVIVDRKKPVARLEPAGSAGTGKGVGWVEDLVGRGVMTGPKRRLDVKQIVSRKLAQPRKGGDVVKALLDEREEGR